MSETAQHCLHSNCAHCRNVKLVAEIESLKAQIQEMNARTDDKDISLKALAYRLAKSLDLKPVPVGGDEEKAAEDFEMYLEKSKGFSIQEISDKFGRAKSSVEKAVKYQRYTAEYVMVSRRDLEIGRQETARIYQLWRFRMWACGEALVGQVAFDKLCATTRWHEGTDVGWDLVRAAVKKAAKSDRFEDAFKDEKTWPAE